MRLITVDELNNNIEFYAFMRGVKLEDGYNGFGIKYGAVEAATFTVHVTHDGEGFAVEFRPRICQMKAYYDPEEMIADADYIKKVASFCKTMAKLTKDVRVKGE